MRKSVLPKWQQKIVAEHKKKSEVENKVWECGCPSCAWTRKNETGPVVNNLNSRKF